MSVVDHLRSAFLGAKTIKNTYIPRLHFQVESSPGQEASEFVWLLLRFWPCHSKAQQTGNQFDLQSDSTRVLSPSSESYLSLFGSAKDTITVSLMDAVTLSMHSQICQESAECKQV